MTWMLAEQEERDRIVHTLDALLAIVAVEMRVDWRSAQEATAAPQLYRVEPHVNSYWLTPAVRRAG